MTGVPAAPAAQTTHSIVATVITKHNLFAVIFLWVWAFRLIKPQSVIFATSSLATHLIGLSVLWFSSFQMSQLPLIFTNFAKNEAGSGDSPELRELDIFHLLRAPVVFNKCLSVCSHVQSPDSPYQLWHHHFLWMFFNLIRCIRRWD